MSTATLGYVPHLRHGAMLFTLIAFRNGHTRRSIKSILDDFYGTIGGRKRNLFGKNVSIVAKRAFGGSVSPMDVLLNHTFFGAYSRALSSSVAGAWSDALITGSSSHRYQRFLRSDSPRARFNLVTQNLRSCSRCVAEDIDEYGFGQWRVLHQIPAIHFCPYHGRPLVEEARGDSSGCVWQLLLPQGKHPDGAGRASWAASDGHATYLKLWAQLFEGQLLVLTSHAWAAFMDLVVARVGGLAAAQAEIEGAVHRTWSTDSTSIKYAIGHQVKEDFIHAELSHYSAPARLAQKLIILGAASALGIIPPNTEETSQLGLDLSSGPWNTHADTLQLALRSFFLESGLQASLAPKLLTNQSLASIARDTGVHGVTVRKAIERIPDKLLEEVASARQWSNRAWVTSECRRRRDKRPSRCGNEPQTSSSP